MAVTGCLLNVKMHIFRHFLRWPPLLNYAALYLNISAAQSCPTYFHFEWNNLHVKQPFVKFLHPLPVSFTIVSFTFLLYVDALRYSLHVLQTTIVSSIFHLHFDAFWFSAALSTCSAEPAHAGAAHHQALPAPQQQATPEPPDEPYTPHFDVPEHLHAFLPTSERLHKVRVAFLARFISCTALGSLQPDILSLGMLVAQWLPIKTINLSCCVVHATEPCILVGFVSECIFRSE